MCTLYPHTVGAAAFLISFVTAVLLPVSAPAQQQAPQFAIVSLDDSTKLISTESLRGKTVLLDFWATWCPPCVEEIPELARVYEKFKDHGFEIVSLSFDKSVAQVQRFRTRRHPMPWLHALVERGFGDYISDMFEVLNIPRQILLDPEGRIVAQDDELRGERLESTVAKWVTKTEK